MRSEQVIKGFRGLRVFGKRDEVLGYFQDLETIYGGDIKFREVLNRISYSPLTYSGLRVNS